MNEELEELEDDGKNTLTIVGENYQLKQVSVTSHLWNLYLKKMKKDGNTHFVIDQYGVTLYMAMLRIINYTIALKLKGQAITLKNYLKIWNELRKSLKTELHSL